MTMMWLSAANGEMAEDLNFMLKAQCGWLFRLNNRNQSFN
jgi:hypothetical protein